MPASKYKKTHNPKSSYEKETISLGGDKFTIKKGALRSMLKVPEGTDISMALLNRIMKKEPGETFMNPYTKKDQKVTALLKKRASLGRTLKKM
jgi:hypothetical protein